jgi:hypothetical protein
MDEATAQTWRAEPRSKITFDLKTSGRAQSAGDLSFMPGWRAYLAVSRTAWWQV